MRINMIKNELPSRIRCDWVNMKNENYIAYHDNEWGRVVHKDEALYELFILETFQAGLSWECVLNKRNNFFVAFDGFDIDRISSYGEKDIERLMNDSGIIRNRRKITAAIKNSRIFAEIQQEFGSFDSYIWSFTEGKVIREEYILRTTSPLSDRISADLASRGMTFVGSTTVYSYLQAIGVIYGHKKSCFCYRAKKPGK